MGRLKPFRILHGAECKPAVGAPLCVVAVPTNPIGVWSLCPVHVCRGPHLSLRVDPLLGMCGAVQNAFSSRESNLVIPFPPDRKGNLFLSDLQSAPALFPPRQLLGFNPDNPTLCVPESNRTQHIVSQADLNRTLFDLAKKVCGSFKAQKAAARRVLAYLENVQGATTSQRRFSTSTETLSSKPVFHKH